MKINEDNRTKTDVSEHQTCWSLLTGAGLALLLMVGLSRDASALTITIPYDYTITANTCWLSSETRGGSGSFVGQFGDFTLTWDGALDTYNVTGYTKSMKTFGFNMNCDGDIYQPRLTITATNPQYDEPSHVMYTTDTTNSAMGFAIQFNNDNTDRTQLNPSITPTNGMMINVSEVNPGNVKVIRLNAWPTLMPDKSIRDITGGMDVRGTVTIEVRYN